MRYWIIAIPLLASFCWATANNLQQTPASPPAASNYYDANEQILVIGGQRIAVQHQLQKKELSVEELAAIQRLAGSFRFATVVLRDEYVAQMQLLAEAGIIHYDPKTKSYFRRPPSEISAMAQGFERIFNAVDWYVNIPIQPQVNIPVPPALGELVVNATPVPTLPEVWRIDLPQGKANSYDLRLPVCREYEEEQICTIPVPVCKEPEGLANPGLRLPTTTVDRWSYTGAFAAWWANRTICPTTPQPGSCSGPPNPPGDPPVPTGLTG